MKGKCLEKYLKNLLLSNHKGGGGVKLKLGIHAKGISLYINCVLFWSDKNSCYCGN